MRCDGLVAATPAGSTGYNLANQGPILAWGVKGYVVSYIAPALADRPRPGRRPERRPHVGNAAGREPVDVVIDGAHAGTLAPGAASTSASSTPSAARPAPRHQLLPPHPRKVRSPSGIGIGPSSRAGRLSRVSPHGAQVVDPRPRLVATFMLLLDVTVVNVALPDIQRELHASLSSLQWVVDAYSLTLAAFLLTAGSLGDRLGRRRVFTVGFGIFTFASFLCGIADDPTLLNLARGLQGDRRGRRCSPPRWP